MRHFLSSSHLSTLGQHSPPILVLGLQQAVRHRQYCKYAAPGRQQKRAGLKAAGFKSGAQRSGSNSVVNTGFAVAAISAARHRSSRRYVVSQQVARQGRLAMHLSMLNQHGMNQ